MKTYGEWRYSSTILDLTIRWSFVPSFTPWSLNPLGQNRGIHRIGGWVDPRTDLDTAEKRRILSLLGIEPLLSNP
jgi:hypothetical protein